jgi:hypothetical protein
MKNKYFLFLVFIFVGGYFTVFAQKKHIIEGFVRDSLKKPIESVSLTIRKGDNIIAFSNSDEKGFFSIAYEIEEDTLNLTLVASSLGYKNQVFELDTKQEKRVYHIVLETQDFMLNEVVVSEKIAIRQSDDTTSYRADAFRDKNDKVIEDILKKLPGFEISKSGAISVYGKSIDKILVEGDDLMNSNYKIISRNLSADMVEKVQVIDRYTEDPLMKGIATSNRQVLNLTFKADRKSTLFGNADTGFGTSERFEESLNLISFMKKAKIYTLGNYNTIGKNSMGDMTQNMLANDENDNLFQRSIKTEYININEISLPNFQSQQVNFNNALLLAPTFIMKPSSKFIIKGGGSLYKDRNILQENSDYQFLTENLVKFAEIKTITKKMFDFKGNIEAVFYPNPKSRIRFLSNWGNSLTNSNGGLQSNSRTNTQNLDNSSNTFESRLFYTNRINTQVAFNLEVFHFDNSSSQLYDVNSVQKLFLPIIDDSTANLNQYLVSPYKYSGIISQYLIKKDKNKFVIQAGINVGQEKLSSNIKFDNSMIDGKNSLKQTDFVVNTIFERELNNFRLNLDCPIHFSDFQFADNQRKELFYLTPKIGLLWKKYNNQFNLIYSFGAKSPQISDLSKFYILNNYRNFQQGTSDFLQIKSNNLYLNYTYKDLFEQLFFNATFLYFKNHNAYNTSLQINNDFNINTLYQSNVANNLYTFSLGINKFLTFIHSTIKLKSNFSLFNFQNQLNSSEIRNINSFNSKYEIGLRSVWKKGVNYHVGAEFNSNTQILVKGNNFNNKTVSSFVEFIFTFSPKLNAQFDFERYSFPNSATVSANFLSGRINYEIKPNALTISLLGKNLTNNRTFSYNYISDYQKSFRTYNVLRRYLMISANFRF